MKFLNERKENLMQLLSAKMLLLLLLDAIIIGVSFFVALIIDNNLSFDVDLFYYFVREIPIVIFIYWIAFELFQMYRSLWQFASFEEIIKGILANAVATIVSYYLIKTVYDETLPFSLYFMAFFVTTFMTLGIRLSYRIARIIKKYFVYEEMTKKALIVGAGSAGSLVLTEVKRNNDLDGSVVGFIDDDQTKLNRTISSIPVLGTCEDIPKIVEEKDIDIVYVALPKASQNRITEILNIIESTGAQIKLFPPFYELLRDRKETKVELRDVRIEDLLGRDEIKLEEDGIRDYIDGKTVVVTGAGGSIGSELCRQLRHFNPKKMVLIDIYENNVYDLQMEFDRMYRLNKVHHKPEIKVLIASVRDFGKIDYIFSDCKPDVVFHAAAHKHVPLMEDSPLEALKNNTVGTYNVAMAAEKNGVEKFVLISTDKAVRSTNIMGASKRAAEKVIMEINKTSKTEFAAVRFGNVLGSNGSVIPLFRKQIEEGGPVTVTHPEIIRYFMTIPEACQLVIQAGAYAKGGELFILDMGEQVKILDLAEKMIRLSGFEPYVDINIVFTGLRPGEKMYEELLLKKEKSIKTDNEMIYIEKEKDLKDKNELPILELVGHIKSGNINHLEIKKTVKKYINSYKGCV
jgi:FlaA1/EpsC-like NDP-sugar epimerase